MTGAALLVILFAAAADGSGDAIVLPKPDTTGRMSLEQALANRRSVRSYAERDLTLAQVGQIAWAAQGITRPGSGYRTSPSAGALYPMDLYLVTKGGVYRYVPARHELKPHRAGDMRGRLAQASLGQRCVARAPLSVVIAAVHDRVTKKYGPRGVMYAHIEAGHIAQNIHLQAVTLTLGSVPVGAFRPEQVKELLGLPQDHEPVYIIPVGHPAP